jgi:hypothetical protein
MPHVFDILRAFPVENLQNILRDDNYSGPSRLGPLADAIRAHTLANRSVEESVDRAETQDQLDVEGKRPRK